MRVVVLRDAVEVQKRRTGMSASKFIVAGLLVFGLLCGCTPSAPAETAITQPVETTSPTTTPEPTVLAAIPLRIWLTTTSDWTGLRLLSGATWVSQELISASEEATTAEVSGEGLVLNQPIDRAEAGGSVQMVVEALFSDWESGGTVVFEIDRGHIGFTRVELSRLVDDEWVVVRTLRWEGIVPEGPNVLSGEIPVAALFGEVPSVAAAPQPAPEAVPVAAVTGMPQGTDGYPWWNDSMFYEIFVRSFYDSDGDGTGDLNGITQKLDYLNDGDPATSTDLGVTGIWLMPIYASPSYHGYNVTDNFSVDPEYGTMEDLLALIDEAHARGIRVILDITLGQTSNLHPWFIASQDPSSPYRDWYIWSDTNPGYLGSWGQEVWHELGGKYFYGTFSAYSPDLNLENPEVTEKLREVVRFWLEDVGVDGFRLDSAKHLIEEGTIQANSKSTHAWWKSLRPFYKQINPQALTVAEIWEDSYITSEYVVGGEVDLAFEIYVTGAIIESVNEGNAAKINKQIALSYGLFPELQFSPTLSNHDQVRTMTQLGDDPQRSKVAASLLLTAPGVPFLYYGEEIGLQGEKPDELIRRPMQWSTDPFGGFSTVTPWEPSEPDWPSVNVELQTDDPASLLVHYRNLIQARNEHAALRVGDLSVVKATNAALYSILRVSQEEAVLVLVNLTGEPVTDYGLALGESSLAEGSYMPAAILGEGAFTPLSTSSTGGFFLYVPVPEVPPYATFILQLQPNAP
jgi:glycosidase